MARCGPLDRIEIDPKVMLGKPIIRGTRITVELIIEKLPAGESVEQVLADYPKRTRDDVLSTLAYASRVLGTDEIIPRIRTA